MFYKPSFWGKFLRFFHLKKRIVNNDVNSHAEDCIMDSPIVDDGDDDPTELVSVTEPKGPRKIRRGRKAAFIKSILVDLREKFVFELTPMTQANYAAVHLYTVRMLQEFNVRKTDRQLVLRNIVERFFVPTVEDITWIQFRNSHAIAQANELVDARIVDNETERWLPFVGRKSRRMVPSSSH